MLPNGSKLARRDHDHGGGHRGNSRELNASAQDIVMLRVYVVKVQALYKPEIEMTVRVP